MQLINSDYNFSYYNNLMSAKEPDNEFDVNQLIEVVKYGYLKDTINKIRAEVNKSRRDKLKQTSLPCVTLSGTFLLRNKNNFIEHSGLMQIDIDKVADYDNLFQALKKDEYTYVAFKSPSGNGIKLIVKISPYIENHLEHFYALEKYYLDEYNIEIDKACKDVSRCMLLSYDPKLYCNPFSEIYAELYMPQPKVVPSKKNNISHNFNIDANNDNDIIESLTKEIERSHIDITNGYSNWISLGFSLASSLGESGRDYFHRLSKFNEGYNPNACDKQYSNLLQRNNGAITLGTFIYLARENGIDVQLQNSKQIKKKKETLTIKENKSTLYEVLKKERLVLANKINKPAFTIFTNKTLEDLVIKKPKTKEELLQIYGISKKKYDLYSEIILRTILNYKEDDLSTQIPLEQKYTLPKFNNEDSKLYDEIRLLRLQLANEKGIGAFRIFGNSILNEIVKLKPKSKKELKQIKGIGDEKIKLFGKEIIELLIANS